MSTTPTLGGASSGAQTTEVRAAIDASALSGLLVRAIIPWYRAHGRVLPWRERADDPYAVWVSEVMLQQTQVATAVPYYLMWLERFPDVAALSAASETSVLHAWQGLGYYGRARRMRETARVVVSRHCGIFPSERTELLALPGIGPYTASAIRAVAFGLTDAAMDVNVTRVLARLCGVPGTTSQAAACRALKSAFETAMNGVRPREAVQAVMELGALICSARSPSCPACPAGAECAAFVSGRPEDYGPRKILQTREARTHVAVVVHHRDRWLLEKRREGGQLAGLWQFPTRELGPGETEAECARRAALEAAGIVVETTGVAASLRHSITRYSITLRAHSALVVSDPEAGHLDGVWRWADADEVAALPMPSAQSRLRATVLAQTESTLPS